ncbi:hypothetical protein DL771_009972 [Monosporascus sp. 5C6A]|nr:hypothetical protein DL771_009972 [Monosporascus sp. 5C6A]
MADMAVNHSDRGPLTRDPHGPPTVPVNPFPDAVIDTRVLPPPAVLPVLLVAPQPPWSARQPLFDRRVAVDPHLASTCEPRAHSAGLRYALSRLSPMFNSGDSRGYRDMENRLDKAFVRELLQRTRDWAMHLAIVRVAITGEKDAWSFTYFRIAKVIKDVVLSVHDTATGHELLKHLEKQRAAPAPSETLPQQHPRIQEDVGEGCEEVKTGRKKRRRLCKESWSCHCGRDTGDPIWDNTFPWDVGGDGRNSGALLEKIVLGKEEVTAAEIQAAAGLLSFADYAAAMSGHSTILFDAAYAGAERLRKEARLADSAVQSSEAYVATVRRQLEVAVNDLEKRKAVAEAAQAACAEHKSIAADLDEKLKCVLSMTSSMQSGPSRGQSAALQPPR